MEYGPRKRERGNLETLTRFSTPEQTILQCNGTNSVYNYDMANVSTGTLEYCEDVVVRDFHARKAAGEIINNPFLKSTDTFKVDSTSVWSIITSCIPGSVRTQKVNSGTVVPGMFSSALAFPGDGDISNAILLAGTRAAAGVQRPDMQLLVDLAEAKKTIRMLTNPFENLYRIIKDTRNSTRYSKWRKKRVRTGGVSNLSAFLSSEWLRYRYGIMPLVYSANGALASTLAISSPRLTSRAGSDVSSGGEVLIEDFTNTWNSSFGYRRKIYGSSHTSVRTGILYEHALDARTRLGLNVWDLPSTGWELIPFSFVADWFVNLGDAFMAAKPRLGVNYLAQWTSVKTVRSSRLAVTLLPTGLAGQTQNPGGTWACSHEQVVRSRTPSVSVGLATKYHEFSWRETDVKHAIDAITLINQLLK